MPNQIINITRQVVLQKIEEMIKNPDTPYDAAFANPQLRQKLLLKVLNRAVPCYGFSTEEGMFIDQSNSFPLSPEEERQIESVIQENIPKVLHEEDAVKYFRAPEQTSCLQEPSHWFG